MNTLNSPDPRLTDLLNVPPQSAPLVVQCSGPRASLAKAGGGGVGLSEDEAEGKPAGGGIGRGVQNHRQYRHKGGYKNYLHGQKLCSSHWKFLYDYIWILFSSMTSITEKSKEIL